MVVFILLFSTISYAQDDFLHITVDIENNDILVESNYNIEEFNIDDYINRIGNEYLFTFGYRSEYKFDDFKLKLILPEESIISEKQDILILSRPVQISSDGRRIHLEWSDQLEENEQITVFVQYKAKGFEINYLLIASVFIIITFVIGYRFKAFDKEKFVKKILSSEEKKVIKIIKRDKEITQNQIKSELMWSKSKTSKIIRNLYTKDLIVKRPYKKTNKIKLK